MDIYNHIRDYQIPHVFPRYYYNGEAIDSYGRRFLSDHSHYRLGPMRIRQKRTYGKIAIVTSFILL